MGIIKLIINSIKTIITTIVNIYQKNIPSKATLALICILILFGVIKIKKTNRR